MIKPGRITEILSKESPTLQEKCFLTVPYFKSAIAEFKEMNNKTQ